MATIAAKETAASPKGKPMPKKQLQYFEKRLIDERKRVLKELGRADEGMKDQDGDLSEYSFHMADQGTEGRVLWHIDEALRRLYRSPDTFGKCHQCGNDIAHERLDALPHARFCIDCKQREEDAKK